MRSAERLSKLLPKSLSLDGGFGGIPELTAQDIAAAMSAGNVTRAEARVLWMLYCDDQTSETRNGLEVDLLLETSRWLATRRFHEQFKPGVSAGKVTLVVQTAIAEMIHDTRCPHCNARGHDVFQHKCIHCAGAGRIFIEDPERAAAAGVELNEWVTRYAWYFKDVSATLSGWASSGETKCARGLGKEQGGDGDTESNRVLYTKRKKKPKAPISVRLQNNVEAWVEKEAQARGVPKSQVIVEALKQEMGRELARELTP